MYAFHTNCGLQVLTRRKALKVTFPGVVDLQVTHDLINEIVRNLENCAPAACSPVPAATVPPNLVPKLIH